MFRQGNVIMLSVPIHCHFFTRKRNPKTKKKLIVLIRPCFRSHRSAFFSYFFFRRCTKRSHLMWTALPSPGSKLSSLRHKLEVSVAVPLWPLRNKAARTIPPLFGIVFTIQCTIAPARDRMTSTHCSADILQRRHIAASTHAHN